MNSAPALGQALLEAAWITARIAAGLGLVVLGMGVVAGLFALGRAPRAPTPPVDPAARRALRAGALAHVVALVLGGAAIALTRGEATRLLPAWLQAVTAAVASVTGPLGGMLGAWSLRALARPDGGLLTRGPYGIVRHPLYLSLALVVVAAGLALGSLSGSALAAGALLAVAVARARREDRALARAHGEAYAAYALRVGGFLPRL